eukprot:scaffold2258_cov17-Prasinocladus_malaysianus.AAC.1
MLQQFSNATKRHAQRQAEAKRNKTKRNNVTSGSAIIRTPVVWSCAPRPWNSSPTLAIRIIAFLKMRFLIRQ